MYECFSHEGLHVATAVITHSSALPQSGASPHSVVGVANRRRYNSSLPSESREQKTSTATQHARLSHSSRFGRKNKGTTAKSSNKIGPLRAPRKGGVTTRKTPQQARGSQPLPWTSPPPRPRRRKQRQKLALKAKAIAPEHKHTTHAIPFIPPSVPVRSRAIGRRSFVKTQERSYRIKGANRGSLPIHHPSLRSGGDKSSQLLPCFLGRTKNGRIQNEART